MRFVRYIGKRCTDEAYKTLIDASAPSIVDRFTERANATLEFSRDQRRTMVRLSPDHQDFLDLALLLYVADAANSRDKASDRWTRDFSILFPVANPELWETAEPTLLRTLTFLSGDRYEFAWPKRGTLPRVPQRRRSVPRQFDAVCLFSGGLDSLIGAYRLLEEGRRLLLVGHKSDSTASKVQRKLAAGLNRLFPDQSVLVQCGAGKSRRETTRFPVLDKVEETHRVRSFLFLALATCLAKMRGLSEVFLPENGLIALNVPLQISRRGTLSTRTAHPIYLERLLDFLHGSGLFEGSIENPFLYMSKTDVVADIPEDLHKMARASVSCAHPGRNGRYENCGYCVACLYRRAALLEIGIDKPDDYLHDVFTKLSTLSALKQQDFRALVQFAEQVEGASSGHLTMLVLSHGPFSPSIGGVVGPEAATDYAPWTDMLKRWSESFMRLVRRLSTKETARILGIRPDRSRRAG